MLSAPDLALVRTLIEGIQCGNELTDCPAADGKAMLVVDGARLKRVGKCWRVKAVSSWLRETPFATDLR